MIAVLAVGAAARFMFRPVFPFLFRAPVFFRVLRHRNPPCIKIPRIVTLSGLRIIYTHQRSRFLPSRPQSKMAFISPPKTRTMPDK